MFRGGTFPSSVGMNRFQVKGNRNRKGKGKSERGWGG